MQRFESAPVLLLLCRLLHLQVCPQSQDGDAACFLSLLTAPSPQELHGHGQPRAIIGIDHGLKLDSAHGILDAFRADVEAREPRVVASTEAHHGFGKGMHSEL